jgi:sugar phosphate isomerase/epimerase
LIALCDRYSSFSNVGITFDAGHANMGYKPLSYLQSLPAGKIVNVHVHDNDGTGDEHLSVGDGTIDFQTLVCALKKSGYAGNIIVERWEPDLWSARRLMKLWDSA